MKVSLVTVLYSSRRTLEELLQTSVGKEVGIPKSLFDVNKLSLNIKKTI